MKNHKRFKFLLVLVLLLFFWNSSIAQLTVVQGSAMGLTPEQLVTNYLVGQGITISNVTINGSQSLVWTDQLGYFETTGDALTQLKLDGGIIMTTGKADLAIGPNNKDDAGFQTNSGTDPDLDILMASQSFDICVLEFDFIPRCDTLSFSYVFGSEEFYEFCGESINDAFGFFLSGPGITGTFSNNSTNIALMPGTSDYVFINNICNDPLSNWNNTGGLYFQYDGMTNIFTAWHLVQPFQTYHLKLAIGDAHDKTHDSGVFLGKNSFSSGVDMQVTNRPSNTAVGVNAIEGCNDIAVTFKLGQPTSSPFKINLNIGGSAINGKDYITIPSSVTIPAGSDSVRVFINPLLDGIVEGLEIVILDISQNNCSGILSLSDTIYIEDNIPLIVSAGNNPSICIGDSAEIRAIVSGGLPPYSYYWTGINSGDSIIKVSPPSGANIYIVNVSDLCNTIKSDSVIVTVTPVPLLTNPTLEKSICSGDSTNILLTANISNALFSWDPMPISGNVTGYSPGTGNTISQILFNEQTNPGQIKYQIMVTGNGCDTSYSDFYVDVNPGFDIDLVDTVFLATGAMAELHAGSGYAYYSWSNGSTDSVITVTAGGIYWVVVEDLAGCKASDTILVKDLGLIVPNAFTPYGDGLNDRFYIKDLDSGLEFRMEIYKRWGEIVFESDDMLNGWDGTKQNQLCEAGVYIWVIRISSPIEGNQFNKSQTYTGNITLLR